MNFEIIISLIVISIIVLEFTRFSNWGKQLGKKGSENVLNAHPIYNVGIKANSCAKIYDPKKWDDYSHILQYDSNELRSNGIENELKINEFRILIIGDSMVQSREVPYEYTFPVLLEKMLKPKIPNVRIISYGVSGWSALTEFLYYKTEGHKFQPDLVIPCLFLNDFTEDYILKDRIVFNSEKIPVAVSPKDPGRVVQEILSDPNKAPKSMIVQLIQTLINNVKESSQRQDLRNRYMQSSNFHDRNDLSTDNLAILNEQLSKNDMAIINDSLNYLNLLNSEVRKNNSHMILTCIPFPQQISLKQCGIMEKTWNFKTSDTLGKPQEIIQHFCKTNDIEFLDLLPELKKNSENEIYFFGASAHLNKTGSQKLADILSSYILKTLKSYQSGN